MRNTHHHHFNYPDDDHFATDDHDHGGNHHHHGDDGSTLDHDNVHHPATIDHNHDHYVHYATSGINNNIPSGVYYGPAHHDHVAKDGPRRSDRPTVDPGPDIDWPRYLDHPI